MQPSSCRGGTMLCHVITDDHKNGDYKMLLIWSLILEAFVKASSCLQHTTKHEPGFPWTYKNTQMGPIRRSGGSSTMLHSCSHTAPAPRRTVSCETLLEIQLCILQTFIKERKPKLHHFTTCIWSINYGSNICESHKADPHKTEQQGSLPAMSLLLPISNCIDSNRISAFRIQ